MWCVQGTVKRWETVAAYVRTRSVNEVLDMVKHGLKAGKFAPKQDTFNVVKKRQVSATFNILKIGTSFCQGASRHSTLGTQVLLGLARAGSIASPALDNGPARGALCEEGGGCFLLQANTVIASEASSRMEAFTDVEVNLSGEAAQSAGPAAAGLVANGHAPEVRPFLSPVLKARDVLRSYLLLHCCANMCQQVHAALKLII